jgi:hypothetical protein
MSQVFFVESDKCVYPSYFMLSVLDQACQTGGPENVSKQCISMLSQQCVSVLSQSMRVGVITIMRVGVSSHTNTFLVSFLSGS